jgi:hypothetical protein
MLEQAQRRKRTKQQKRKKAQVGRTQWVQEKMRKKRPWRRQKEARRMGTPREATQKEIPPKKFAEHLLWAVRARVQLRRSVE